MKNNQKGFSAVEMLITAFIVILLGAIGWLVYDRQNSKSDDNSAIQTRTEQSEDDSKDEAHRQDTAKSKIDTAIHEVNISLKSEEDLAKLPDYTPVSFKSYIAEELRNSKSFDNGDAIVTETWIITRISQVNIQGGQVTDNNGTGYAGGTPLIWVLAPNGTWDQGTLNGPTCTSKNGGKIYEEFAAICFNYTHQSGIKNPNGSIKSLVQ